MIVSIAGTDKSGKTTVGLSFPKKLVIFENDLNTVRRAIHRFPGNKLYVNRMVQQGAELDINEMLDTKMDYIILQYPSPLNLVDKNVDIESVWKQFIKDYAVAIRHKKVNTLSLETATRWWGSNHTTYLQQLQKNKPDRERLLPVEYGEPNNRMAAVINAARTMDKNLVLVHHLRHKHKDIMTASGVQSIELETLEPDGFKYTGSLVELEIWMEQGMVQPEGDDDEALPVPGTIGTISLSGLALELKGMKIENPTYDKIVKLVEMFRGED